MLSDTFLNPSEITLSLSLASAKVFKTTGARNCDKVNTWIGYYPKKTGTKDTFMEWIQWKQKESGSRRHLILFYGLCWSLVALTAYQEMLEDLKNTFETATEPLNYVITFANELYPSEFHLNNERTGERLSLFRDKRYCFRLWRRTVTSSDSTWLSALIGGKRMEKEVREAPRETGFDEEFYGYFLPVK